jgi:hypothetical protein
MCYEYNYVLLTVNRLFFTYFTFFIKEETCAYVIGKNILILFIRVEEMFKQLDRDGDGTLDYNEFAQMLGI